MISDDKAIVACATGNHAHCAIAIIRVSGFKSLDQLAGFFKNKSFHPFQMTRSDFIVDNEVWDDLCYCYFQNPKSYTGENLLELYVHGNTLNVHRILKVLSSLPDFRMAKAGEFTLRALQNNKITLSQAEGLDLFLNASTPLALTQGLSLLHGELHQHYLSLYESFKVHKAALELLLDFHEDVGESQAFESLNSSWKSFKDKIHFLNTKISPHSSRLLRPEVVVAGLPNAGKSTFFNLVLGERRAIVSSTAGTTRDYLTEDFSIKDVTYRLVDTAGIREASDEIEKGGIEFSFDKIKNAFFRILLINPLETDLSSLKNLLNFDFDQIVFTHSDCEGFEAAKDMILRDLGVVLSGHIETSLVNPSNINWLGNKLNSKYLSLTEHSPILQDRHKQVISAIYDASILYENTRANESDIAILSHELNTLGHCLEELLGIVSPDEVLDHIFSNFCIGK